MAKLEKIIVTKVAKGEQTIGYYRNHEKAVKDFGDMGPSGVSLKKVEIYIDLETNKIYVLHLAAPDGRLRDQK